MDTRSLVSEISLAIGYLDESFIHQRFDAAHPEYVKGSLTSSSREINIGMSVKSTSLIIYLFYSEARKILRRVSVLFDALVEKRADINSDYHACKSSI